MTIQRLKRVSGGIYGLFGLRKDVRGKRTGMKSLKKLKKVCLLYLRRMECSKYRWFKHVLKFNKFLFEDEQSVTV